MSFCKFTEAYQEFEIHSCRITKGRLSIWTTFCKNEIDFLSKYLNMTNHSSPKQAITEKTERKDSLRSKEEVFNALTHFIGLCMVPCISWVLIWFGYAKNWQNAFGVTFFTVGMLLMYLASSLYHWWKPQTRGKLILRKLDHISIYVLIASSYTPICMQLVEDKLLVEGWVSFGIIWTLAVLGIFYKIFWWIKYPKLSLILYIALGWAILFIIPPVRQCITPLSLFFIAAEGFIYTLGVYFFVNDATHRYYHGIWHIFVILGTLCHWAAVFVMSWPWDEGLFN